MLDFAKGVRRAVRSLVRAPGFLAVSVVTLALVVGANTAMFALAYGVLVRPLPFQEPERLVRIGLWEPGSGPPQGAIVVHTPGHFADWVDGTASLGSLAAYTVTRRTLAGAEGAERVTGVESIGSLLDVLGVQPTLGRVFGPGADVPGDEGQVVVRASLAQRSFGEANPLGRTLSLDGAPYEVIGVVEDALHFPTPETEFWLLSSYGEEFLANRTEFFLRTVARLADGRTLEDTRAELGRLDPSIRARTPEARATLVSVVLPLQDVTVAEARPLLLALLGSVLLLFLIACLNLANLVTARTLSRAGDIAVRRALGGTTTRIAGHLALELGVLASVSALVGWLLSDTILRAMLGWLPPGLPRVNEVRLGVPSVAYTIGLTVVAAALFGLLPALWSARGGRAAGSRATSGSAGTGGRLGPGGRVTAPARGAAVVLQLALAVMLLSGSGLLIRSFRALVSVPTGFEVDRRLTFQASLPSGTPLEVRQAFFGDLEREITALPGVLSVGMTSALPASGTGSRAGLNLIGMGEADPSVPQFVAYRVTSGRYLETMGIPLLEGRDLRPGDGFRGTPSVLVNRTMAEAAWPGLDPIGRSLTLGPGEGWIPPSTVVGVVDDVRMDGLDRSSPPVVYALHELMPWWDGFHVVVHTAGEPVPLIPGIRRVVNELRPDVPIYGIDTVEGVLAASLAQRRGAMAILSTFALVAVVMAVVGVFGLLSFLVTLRTREIGVRIALGADPGSVWRWIAGRGMAQVALGVVLGLVGTALGTRLLSALIYGVEPLDPASIGFAVGLLALAAFVAVAIPAGRAARVEPVRALGQG